MAERVLITGVTGFAGSHLAEFLTSLPGVEIYGTRRWRSDTGHIDHLSDRISIVECDVRDLTSVLGVLRSLRPQKIFHLAAQSHVAISWDAPEEALTTNILGTLHLLEAVRQLEMDPLILVAGLQRGIRYCRAPRVPPEGDECPSPHEPLRGQQGGPGPSESSVCL